MPSPHTYTNSPSGPVVKTAEYALYSLVKSNPFVNPTKPQLQGEVNAKPGR